MGPPRLTDWERPGKSAGKRGTPTREEAEAIAISALGHIAADEDRLGRFLDLTGLDSQGLRQAAAEPGFLVAVLDHLAGYEPDLLAFAAESGTPPERIGAARAILAGQGWND